MLSISSLPPSHALFAPSSTNTSFQIKVTQVLRQGTRDNGEYFIDIDQLATGGVKGTTEKRTLDWTYREHSDWLFGDLKGKSRWSSFKQVLEDAKDKETNEQDDAKWLTEGWLPETSDGEVVEAYVESNNKGWTSRQVRILEPAMRFDFVVMLLTGQPVGLGLHRHQRSEVQRQEIRGQEGRRGRSRETCVRLGWAIGREEVGGLVARVTMDAICRHEENETALYEISCCEIRELDGGFLRRDAVTQRVFLRRENDDKPYSHFSQAVVYIMCFL